MKKILRSCHRAFFWIVAFILRIGIVILTFSHRRIRHGPSARLWLASDLEIAAEAKRRGLFKRRKKQHSPNVLPMPTAFAPEVHEFNVKGELAAKAVAQLQECSLATARDAVHRALETVAGDASVDQIVIVAMKLVA